MSRPTPVRSLALALALAPALAATGCGYFNAMYNAQRRFGDARSLERHGDRTGAARAYLDAIDRAATSYRGHPNGKWADDALLLIGRSRFALGEYEASRAAFRTLLGMQPEPQMAATARAYIGAATVALGEPADAVAMLDDALAARLDDRDAVALAHLWRARARFDLGDAAAAWADLDAAASVGGAVGTDARLEMAGRAAAAGDTARVRQSAERLFADAAAAHTSDSLAIVVAAAADVSGAAWAASLLHDVGRVWPAASREMHELARIRFTAEAGDTAAAVDDALRLAGRASAVNANRARTVAARLALAGTDDVARLDAVRAMLLPAIADPEARDLVHFVRAVEVLLARATNDGEPLALFVAAEIAREELNSPGLAYRFFLAYADAVPDALWAPKALLAAADLDPVAIRDVAARFSSRSDNVYVRAVNGEADPEAYRVAELTLARTLAAQRESALQEADARDVRVTSVIARLDSLDAVARADSVRVRCGALIDSLSIAGIRADSLRAACIRSDTARVTAVLRIDTLMLVDTARLRRRGRGIDTTATGGG
jgi:tetratricopeptide (TPR) repeat protein